MIEASTSNDQLLKKYLTIFLEVSEKLQHIKVTPKEINDLLEVKCPDLYIIYGYFVELEPNQNHVIYFIESTKENPDPAKTNFEPPLIPYYYGKASGKNEFLYKTLLKSEKNFISILKSPKLYQHLPIQEKSLNKFKLISDDYLNCYISNKIKRENDYYVVLFEEIIFFQFAYCYLNGDTLSKYYIDRKDLLLIYLIKFGLSIEHKYGGRSLHEKLGIIDKKKSWNEKEEIDLRKEITDLITKKISDNGNVWEQDINVCLKEIVDLLLRESKKSGVYYKYYDEKTTNLEILKHVARFDIEASFLITDDDGRPIFHDMFVFPLYTEMQFGYPTKWIDPAGNQIDIHSPVLLVLYIKTLYEISNQQDFDETPSSIQGFQLTKEIAKLFAERIIQQEYLKNVIKKQTILQATKSAISQYMCRNLSHNLGSHSIPQFNLKLDQMIREKQYWSSNDLYQIRGFNEYIQGRMEFLAEFSSNNFSELYIEHSFKKIVENLVFSMNKIGEKRGEYEIVFKGMVDSFVSENVTISINDIPTGNELVDIRGDNLGIQAFYIIIENVIRNLYKHSNKIVDRGRSYIEFGIKIFDFNPDGEVGANYYTVDIFDKHGKVNEEKWIDEDKAQKLIKHINDLISQSILKEDDNTLREEGWGLLEMKSAAAYLSGMPDYAIDTKLASFRDDTIQYKEHIKIDGVVYPYPLKAFFFEGNNDSSKNIAYRFYLPKTKFCLIDNPAPHNEFVLNELGIEFGKNCGSRHNFFISDNESLIDNFINQRSVRFSGLESLINNLSKSNLVEFKKAVWSKYLSRYPELESKELFYATDSSPKIVYSPGNSIVFDNHQKNITCNSINSMHFNSEYLLPPGKSPLFYYYESFPSSSKLSSDINPLDEPYCSMLKEAAAVKVSIFDERIQANSFEQEHQFEIEKKAEDITNKNTKSDILLTSGVYIPHKNVVDLLEMAKVQDEKSKQKFIDHLIARIEFSEYIIVHFTLLEVFIGKTGKDEIEKWLKEFIINNKLNERKKALVLISGRGKPSNLPKGFYFANYTMIADCVGRNRSKLRLVTILKSLRK